MSGANDQTDGTEASETEGEDAGSTEELTPEAEREAAWAEFTGQKPESDEDEDGDGSGEEAGASAADQSGQETSDTDDDPSSEAAEGEQSAEGAEEQGESSAEAPDGAASGEDIWETAPDELRAAFDAEKARAARAEQQAASDRGRMSALQTRYDALLGKAPEQPTSGAADTSPDAGDSRPNPFESDEWKGLREEFGDIAEPIEQVLSGHFAATTQEIAALKDENRRLRQGMETIGQDRLQSRAQSQEAEVREAHPDLDDVLTSDEFEAWAQAAPAYIRQGLERNGKSIVDAAEASDIISRFKSDTGFGSEGDEGDGSGSSTEQDAGDADGTKDAGGTQANGKDGDGSKPAAPSRRRQIQLKSAAAPRTRSGEAAVSDKEPETEAEMWDWAVKKVRSEREAAI